MSKPRALLSALLLLLAASVLLLFYLQRNLQELAANQLEQRLAGYGVQRVTLGNIELGRRQLTLDSVQLAGDFAGQQYEARLEDTRVGYTLASLRALNVRSVQVERLEIILTAGEAREPAASAAPALRLSDWLARPANAALPLDTLSLPSVEVRYRVAQQEPVVLAGNIQLSEKLTLGVSGVVAQEPFAVHISAAEDRADASFSVGDDSRGPFLQSTIGLTPVDTQARTQRHWLAVFDLDTVHAPLRAWLERMARALDQAESAALLEGLQVLGRSTLKGRVTLPDTLPLDDLASRRMPPDLAGNAVLDTQFQGLSYAGELQAASGQLTLTLEHTAAQWQAGVTGHLLGILDAARLPLPEATLATLGFDSGLPFSLTLPDSQALSVTLKDSDPAQWKARLQHAELALGNARNRVQALALNAQALGKDSGATTAQLSTAVHTLLQGRKLPSLSINADHQGSLTASTYKVSLVDSAEDITLLLAGTADFTAGSGEHALELHMVDMASASANLIPLLTQFGLVANPPEINAGRLTLTSNISTGGFDREDWRQHAELAIEGASGLWEGIAFTDLSVNTAWQGIEAWQTTRPLQLRIAAVQPGFSISNITASLRLPSPTPISRPTVLIENFSARLFGGQVSLQDDTRWDFAADRNSLTLRAREWSLAELVALQQNAGIAAQGELNGELPLTLAGQRIIVNGGSLRSAPPGGTIRYQPDAATASMGAGSSELNMALELLRDFRFEQLSSSVDLDESGQLTLGLALSGRNPNQQAGRPVNFNINIQQNIDPLLQSLRLDDTLVKDIEKGLR